MLLRIRAFAIVTVVAVAVATTADTRAGAVDDGPTTGAEPPAPELAESPAGDGPPAEVPAVPPAPRPPDPPPPQFAYPPEAGLALAARVEQASVAGVLTTWRVAELDERRDEERARLDDLLVRHARLRVRYDAAAAEVEDRRDRFSRIAADAYMRGAPLEVSTVIRSLGGADSMLTVERDLHFASQYGADELGRLTDAQARHRRLTTRLAEIVRVLREQRRLLRDTEQSLAEAERQARAAMAERVAATAALGDWHAAADHEGSSILGPSSVRAEDLAGFVRSLGFDPQLTVPLDELAAMFLEEGERLGVRGDVAWAQSILETGFFSYPAFGKVRATDNNFAGIGACDSCATGRVFVDARAGVRAQIQLLRTYVDPDWPDPSTQWDSGVVPLAPEDDPDDVLLPNALRLGFRGDVASWYHLGGRWATGPDYGRKIATIYRSIRTYAAQQAARVSG